jgi:tetratricopeptide (TPR) repeat protein
MKKKILYFILLSFFITAVAIIIYKYSNTQKEDKSKTYALLPRKGTAATAPEWLQTKEQGLKLLKNIEANPNDTKSLTQLATLYIREARITGNYAYYDKAALTYVNSALAVDSANFEALVLKSLLYLSQHHFSEGLELANKAKAINPYNAFVFGVAVDGNVEMGNYDSAVANADKMLAIRPDLRSYSRASYLREIYGDYPGAIEAMKMAVEAGAPGDEATEWTRTQLAHLYENIGDMKSAEMYYTISNDARPGYAYALAGLGRIAAAKKDYNKAISYLTQADTSVTDFSIKESLADVYREIGQPAKADALQKEVINAMNGEVQSSAKDQSLGHYVDKELAYAYLKVKDYDNALKHALLEYNRRPDNIDVNECVAWVYYSMGEYDKALPYIKVALRTNCKNPTLLCRAGLIYAKAGEKSTAKITLQQALQANANIANELKMQGVAALQAL